MRTRSGYLPRSLNCREAPALLAGLLNTLVHLVKLMPELNKEVPLVNK
jgi:hypothetical protein